MGRGSRGGRRGATTQKRTPLEAFKENARQFNVAKQEALKAGADKLEFTDITGMKKVLYRSGNSWQDRPNSMERKYGTKGGTFKAKYKD